MNAKEVVARLKEELRLPNFVGNVQEKEYSEEDYQQVKKDLLKYYEDYVGNLEGYFPGTDMIENKD
ncbi:hypothetical protein SAMN02745116_00715 [Pilibacter termitis]|uniref:Uncharacterized protein n=1 Tax=Pilibacter termitis TaxID=263852 RepID=A0A1T4LLN3_9ENTE|nr:hypothetical protein [Pilibacter termitis]SJZ55643.1 hypothetical protein SAMN02745116_00715 [Pilibacter termitis]